MAADGEYGLPIGIWDGLPQEVRKILKTVDPEVLQQVEEIRLRSGRPLELVAGDGTGYVGKRGLQEAPAGVPPLEPILLTQTLEMMAGWSLYAVEEQLRRGFLTLKGGHRCGVVGRAAVEDGRIRTLLDVGGLNIRVARSRKGVSRPLLPLLLEEGTFRSTLLVGPPQAGKTTLLRDLVRIFAGGEPQTWNPGLKVSLLDERGEVAACHRGMAELDVGPRTDVLEGAPKGEGMTALLRAMSPQMLATDEIGGADDARALWEAEKSGVAVLATAHAVSASDLWSRPSLAVIMEAGVFDRLVLLERRRGRVVAAEVRNGKNVLLAREVVLP